MTHRVALAMICGDDSTSEDWERLLTSVEGQVAGVYVFFNGRKEVPKALLRSGIQVERGVWTNNFAAARNRSFGMVPTEEYDWLLWLDHDDELVAPEGLSSVIDGLDLTDRAVLLRYDYARDPETDSVVVTQWRERLLSTKVRWRWVYEVHEVCQGPPSARYGKSDQAWVVHHRVSGANEGVARRNRRILAKMRRKRPNDKRAAFYMANEVFAEIGRADEPSQQADYVRAAVKAYGDFLAMDPIPEDAYFACCRIADGWRIVGEWERAIGGDLRALKFLPSHPDAYVGLATTFMHLKDWDKVIHWSNAALSTSKPVTASAQEPLKLRYEPLLLHGLALENKGDLESALDDYRQALVEIGANRELEEKIKRLEDDEIAPEGVERREGAVYRRNRFGSRSDRSIAFVTRPLFEPWHPLLEREGGAGGAETCVMRLAERFARDNWRVVVFGTPGEHYGVDPETGVEWWSSADYDPAESFSVLIGSRCPEVFDGELNAKVRLLWMHDVNSAGTLVQGRFGPLHELPDRIVALTHWHARHLSRLYDIDPRRIQVISNGIELTCSEEEAAADRSLDRMVYASSADRGLDVLLDLWPEIKENRPAAELHIYYGWDAINRILKIDSNTPTSARLQLYKQSIEEALDRVGREEAGVFWHGRRPQKELLESYLKTGIWTYPTYFLETNCITALETQLAGVVPVTSLLGGLRETVHSSALRISGWPNNETYRRVWLEALMSVFEIDSVRLREDRRIRHHFAKKRSWDNIYLEWVALIDSVTTRQQESHALALGTAV